MNTKTLGWILGIGAATYGIWYMVKYMHVTPREKDILVLTSSKYAGFDDAFLKSWADAVKSKKEEFTYNGKVYLSKTGTAKK